MEDAAFDEMLALLAGDEGVWTAVEGFEDPREASASSGGVCRPQVAVESDASSKPRPKTRRSRKQEVAELREEAKELIKMLKRLKEAAGIDWATPVARVKDPRAGARESDTPVLQLWKRLAMKQRDLRHESEKENKTLRVILTTLVRRGKRLRLMAQKRAMKESRQLFPLVHHPDSICLLSLPDDRLVWKQLAEGLDGMYASIDTTFEQVQMHLVPRPGRVGGMRSLGLSGDRQPTLCQVHVVPFEFKFAEQAVWNYFSRGLANQGNEAARSYKFAYSHPVTGTFMIQQRDVTRRYKESNRSVIVNRSLTEPMPGVFTHSAYLVAIKEGEQSVCGPTSVIELLLSSSSGTPEAEMRACTTLCGQHGITIQQLDLGLTPWEKELDRMISFIECTLVNSAVSISQ